DAGSRRDEEVADLPGHVDLPWCFAGLLVAVGRPRGDEEHVRMGGTRAERFEAGYPVAVAVTPVRRAQPGESGARAVAMSERGAGSRLSGLSTSYRRDGDGYRITGLKSFCSGASHADVFFVAARAADRDEQAGEAPGKIDVPGKISHFLVPAGPGVDVEPNWDTLGMRGTGSHDLRLDVWVPADALVGGLEGLSVLVAQVMPQWLVASYAAVYAGVARAAFDAGAQHARGRTAP